MSGVPRRSSGFTMIEMVVVIAVLGLILGVLAQYRPQHSRWTAVKGAAGQIAAAMSADRRRAIASGAPVRFTLPRLPRPLAVAVTPAGGIVFEPDGSAIGGTVLLDAGGRRISVAADWLTGRVRLDAP